MKKISFFVLTFPQLLAASSFIVISLVYWLRNGEISSIGLILLFITSVFFVSCKNGVRISGGLLEFYFQFLACKYVYKFIKLDKYVDLYFDKTSRHMTVAQYSRGFSWRGVSSFTYSIKGVTVNREEILLYATTRFDRASSVCELISNEVNLKPERRLLDELYPTLEAGVDRTTMNPKCRIKCVDVFFEEVDSNDLKKLKKGKGKQRKK